MDQITRPPLHGLRIVELAGIGPGPFAGMMLADHGAEVIRIDRSDGAHAYPREIQNRSRRSIVVNLKDPDGIAVVRALCRKSDGFIEGLRPGVTERLGIGPDVLLGDNPRLVYGRITGWGQTGPLSRTAGHDLNYLALSGALHPMGRADDKPPVPLNLIADFGGGGMLLAFGMVSGILAAKATGQGQVIDAAMTEGAALLAAMFFNPGELAGISTPRGRNMLGGAAPYYDTYTTSDGQFIALGAIEPQFYAQMLAVTGLADDPDFARPLDPSTWPAAKAKLAAVIATRTRDEWCERFAGHDACFAPVLSLAEAPDHPQHRARSAFVEACGITQPAPAPRYSRSTTCAPALTTIGADTDTLLAEAGFDPASVARLRSTGAVRTT